MITILNYKPKTASALQGTFTIKVEKWGNFLIHEMSYFKKDNQRWVSFPSKPYEKEGKKKYFQYNNFETPEMADKFKEKVLEALDKFLMTQSPSVQTMSNIAGGFIPTCDYSRVPFM